MIFSELLDTKYKISKDANDKQNLLIHTNNKEIKCKSIMFMTSKIIDNKTKDNLILWSDSNPYIDQYTREISKTIRTTMYKEKKYILEQNNQLITTDDLENLINSLIKNQYNFIDKNGKSINCNWILTNTTESYIEYYMITDIIYY
jgi:hypothetical protein